MTCQYITLHIHTLIFTPKVQRVSACVCIYVCVCVCVCVCGGGRVWVGRCFVGVCVCVVWVCWCGGVVVGGGVQGYFSGLGAAAGGFYRAQHLGHLRPTGRLHQGAQRHHSAHTHQLQQPPDTTRT